MAKFVYLYKGGKMAETPAAQEKSMQAWGAWFGALGDVIADGGAPFGTSATVSSGGSVNGASTSGVSGYTVVNADSLSDATEKAKGCPILADGGSVEVYEAIPM